MKKLWLFVWVFSPVLGLAQTKTLVPVVAWGAPGAAGNRWNTELFLTNVGSRDVDVWLQATLPLRLKASQRPCLPPVTPVRVAAWSTRVVYASELNRWLGCPEEFVGGMVFEHGPGVRIASRMTNTRGLTDEAGTRPLRGYSQEIPGIELSALPGGEGAYLIPTLAWHPNPCEGGSEYDSYLYFANPGPEDLTVRLLARPGTAFRFRLGEQEVELPYALKVPAGRLVQVALLPPLRPGAPCGASEFFDLLFVAEGRVGVLASVVDRWANDARTVMVTRDFLVESP
ncbi:MAG: hypothetical protein NZ869_10480 [Thermoanaerobaculum sp.]|nr:hypothetical protein [Thermoanaerobaculum sp.]MDW7967307.1 hypothetical protein [Thermoanaerobaculum sp.]